MTAGPPPGWDPDEAARRIRARAERIGRLHEHIRRKRPMWTDAQVEQMVQWLTRRPR
ncbi:MAG: hypothetical protein KGQ66_13145 [Acidobacteriota bacterium]|nr:hypothetical protein [Acidobacteriota bacterium]